MPQRVISLPRPLPHQLDFLRSPALRKCLVAGRRWGKSESCLIPIIDGHGPGCSMKGAAHGMKGAWVAPTFKIATIIWAKLKRACAGAWSEKHELPPKIVFPGGGSIEILTAHDPDNLRGEEYDFMVIDEAALLREDAWENVLEPMLATPPSRKPAWAIFISTPAGVDNWFRKKFDEAERRAGWARWQRPSSDNPIISRAFLEEKKATISSYAWRQEYQAEFVTKGGGLFKPEDALYYTVRDDQFVLDDGTADREPTKFTLSELRMFVTCDTATSTKSSADHTAIASWGISPRGHLVLVDLYLKRVEGGEIMRQIVAACQKWECTAWVEENSTSKHLLSLMEESGIPFRTVEPGSQDKWTRAQDAVALWERHRVAVPRDAAWRAAFERQLFGFEPKGKDDDAVDAFAYAARIMRDEFGEGGGAGIPEFVPLADSRARDLPSGVSLARPGSRPGDGF